LSSRIRLHRGTYHKLEGPASIKLIEGSLSVLGKPVRPRELLTVSRFKALPLEALVDSIAEVKLGSEASLEPLSTSPIPREWGLATEQILSSGRQVRVMVLGDVDSGKATFCTFLANKFLEAGLKVGILDCDPGQAELFVPTTISLGLVNDFITGIDKASLAASYFIGSTSPSGLADRVLTGVRTLMEEAARRGVEALVINTNGWTLGRGARMLKQGLLNIVRPSHLVLIQRSTEVEHLARPYAASRRGEVLRIPVSSFTKYMSREDRRIKRELAFKSYFAKAKVRKLSLDVVGLMYTLFTTGFRLNRDRLLEVEEAIGQKAVYAEESPDSLLIVVERPTSPHFSELAGKLKERFAKEEVLITYRGAERGLVAGLLDQNATMLGLGVVKEIDYEERTITLLTPVEEPISIVQVGQIKLDEECREVARVDGWPL